MVHAPSFTKPRKNPSPQIPPRFLLVPMNSFRSSVWVQDSFPLSLFFTLQAKTHPHPPASGLEGWPEQAGPWEPSPSGRRRLLPPSVGDSLGCLPHPLARPFHWPEAAQERSRPVGSATCTMSCQLWVLEISAPQQVVRFFHSGHRNALHFILCLPPAHACTHTHTITVGLALLTFPLHYSTQLEHNIPSPSLGIPHRLKTELCQKLPFL